MAHSGPPAFLATACRSLAAQEFRDFELVVVDDGADLDWDAALSPLGRPWRVLRNPARCGLAQSLNRAAGAASGALLARMDSDDVSEPARLKLQVTFLEGRPDVAFLGSAVYWLDQTGRHLGRNYPLTEPPDVSVGLSSYNQMCHGSMLVRREAFEALGGYDGSLGAAQDYELWLRASRAGYAFANLPEPLYGHRLHSASISARVRSTQSGIAARVRARESNAARSARWAAWFAAGRDGQLGRPHESLQMGRLALLLSAALAARRLEAPARRAALRFSARHAGDAAELLMREVGWRHGTPAKVRNVLGGS
jgi:GT2 family glycosyltransferase